LISEDEKKVANLWEQIKNLERPKAPEDWVPIGLDGDRFVVASKTTDDIVKIKSFEREGIWDDIWRYFKKRNDLFEEMGRILENYPKYNLTVF